MDLHEAAPPQSPEHGGEMEGRRGHVVAALRKHCTKGVTALAEKRPAAAKAAFAAALKVHAGCAVALMGNVLADIQSAGGAVSHSIPVLRSLAKLSAESVRRVQGAAAGSLVSASAYNDKYDKELPGVDDARADLFFRYNLATALHCAGGVSDAERALTHIVETLRRGQGRQSTGLGHQAAGRGGQLNEAQYDSSQSAQLAASLPNEWHTLLVSALLNLGLLRDAAGRFGEACKQYRAAISIGTAGSEALFARHLPPGKRAVLDLLALTHTQAVTVGSVFQGSEGASGGGSPRNTASPRASMGQGGSKGAKASRARKASAVQAAFEGMTPAAQEYLATMRKLLVTGYTALAAAQMKLGAPVVAVRALYGKALTLDDTCLPALAGAATADEISGSLPAAVTLLSRAVSLAGPGQHTGLWVHLGRLLQALGRSGDALACLRTAVEQGGEALQSDVTPRHSGGPARLTPLMSLRLTLAQSLLAGGDAQRVAEAGSIALEVLGQLGIDASARTAAQLKAAEKARVRAADAAGMGPGTPGHGPPSRQGERAAVMEEAGAPPPPAMTPLSPRSGGGFLATGGGAGGGRVRDPHSIDWTEQGVLPALVVWASSCQRTGHGWILAQVLEAYLPAVQQCAVALHEAGKAARWGAGGTGRAPAAGGDSVAAGQDGLDAVTTRRLPHLPQLWAHVALLYVIWSGITFERGGVQAANGGYYAAVQALVASAEVEKGLARAGGDTGGTLLGSGGHASPDATMAVPCWWSLGVVRYLYRACAEYGIGVASHLLARPDRALRHLVRGLDAVSKGREAAHANAEAALGSSSVRITGPKTWTAMAARLRYCMALALEGVGQAAAADKQLAGILEGAAVSHEAAKASVPGSGPAAPPPPGAKLSGEALCRAAAALAAAQLRCHKPGAAVVVTADMLRSHAGSGRMATAHALTLYHASADSGGGVETVVRALTEAKGVLARAGVSIAALDRPEGAARGSGAVRGEAHAVTKLDALLDAVYVHFSLALLLHLRHVRQWNPRAMPGISSALHQAGAVGGDGGGVVSMWQRDEVGADPEGGGGAAARDKSQRDALNAIEEYRKALKAVRALHSATAHLVDAAQAAAPPQLSAREGPAPSASSKRSEQVSAATRRRRERRAAAKAAAAAASEGEGKASDGIQTVSVTDRAAGRQLRLRVDTGAPRPASEDVEGSSAGRDGTVDSVTLRPEEPEEARTAAPTSVLSAGTAQGGLTPTFVAHVRTLQVHIRTCLGCAHASTGALQEAMRQFEEAGALDGENRIVGTAQGAVQAALRRNSTMAAAYTSALALYREGDFAGAAALLRKGTGGSTTGTPTRHTLLYGLCLCGQGAAGEGHKHLARYVAAWPTDHVGHTALAAACFALYQGRRTGPYPSMADVVSAALDHAQRAIGLTPAAMWQAHAVSGQVFHQRKKHAAARDSFSAGAAACALPLQKVQLMQMAALAARAGGGVPSEIALAFRAAADCARDVLAASSDLPGEGAPQGGMFTGLVLEGDGEDAAAQGEVSGQLVKLSAGDAARVSVLQAACLHEGGLQLLTAGTSPASALAEFDAAAAALEHSAAFSVRGAVEQGALSSGGSASSLAVSDRLAPSPSGAWAGLLPVPHTHPDRPSNAHVASALVEARKLLVEVHHCRAVCGLRQRNAAGAAAAAYAALAYNPHHTPALVCLGDAFSGANRHDLAARVYSNAARAAGDEPGGAIAKRLDRAVAQATAAAALASWRESHPQGRA